MNNLNHNLDSVSTYYTRVILPTIRALCARVRTLEPSEKSTLFFPFYARTLLLLRYYYYYYYYIRSTCVHMYVVVNICSQVCRKGGKGS